MNSLILGLIVFQLIYSIDVVFPNFFRNWYNWHMECFEPMNMEGEENVKNK